MNIKYFIGRKLNNLIRWVKTFTPDYIGEYSRSGLSGAVEPYDNYQNNIDSINYSLWAYICIDRIAKVIAGLPLKFYIGYNDNKKEVTDNPAMNLIYRPNPFGTHRELFIGTVWNILGTGSAYWHIDELGFTGKIIPGKTKIWTMPSDKVKVKKSPVDYIAGYILTNEDGKEIFYPVDEIVHFKNYSPKDPYYGMSPLAVAQNVLEPDYYARQLNKNFFKNGGQFGNEFTTDLNLTEKEVEKILNELNADYGGYDKAHKFKVYTNGLKRIDTKRNPKDLDFEKLIRLDREEVIALFGIPPAVVGLFEYANYANALIQQEMFWQYTIIPFLQHIEVTLNELIFPRWGYPDLYMSYDLSGVKVLQKDTKDESTTALRLYRAGIITLNEARARVDYDSVDSGDEFYTPTNLFGSGLETEPVKGFGIKAVDSLNEIWQKRDDFRRRHENRAERNIKGYLERLRIRVIDNINKYNDDNLPESVDDIFESENETKMLLNILKPDIEQAFKDAGQNAFDQVQNMKSWRGISTKQPPFHFEDTFNLTDPEIVAFLENHALDACVTISGTLKNIIGDLLTSAYESGAGRDEIARLLKNAFDEIKAWKAKQIAQTEMGIAVSKGTHEGYSQAGADQKKWLANFDSRVRDSHYDLGLQAPIPIDERWVTIHNNFLLHPHDSNAPPEEVINCRCVEQAIVDIE